MRDAGAERDRSGIRKSGGPSLSLSILDGRPSAPFFESIEEKQGDGEDWKTLSLPALVLLYFEPLDGPICYSFLSKSRRGIDRILINFGKKTLFFFAREPN